MQLTTPRRTGRPPKRATGQEPALLSVRLTPEIKNLLIDLADGYDLSIADYLTLLIQRDADT